MARQNRRDLFGPKKASAFHCVQRTVRRAWLCGQDPVSGKSFEYRRAWIQDRLAELAGSFGIDCLSFCVMVTIDERSVAYRGAMPSETGKRASDKGFLAMSLEAYLKFLDWTGRQLRRDNKGGRIPSELAPILERIGLSGELWCDVVKRFGKIFKRVAGAPETLAREAIKKGRSGYRTSGWPEPAASYLAGPRSNIPQMANVLRTFVFRRQEFELNCCVFRHFRLGQSRPDVCAAPKFRNVNSWMAPVRLWCLCCALWPVHRSISIGTIVLLYCTMIK